MARWYTYPRNVGATYHIGPEEAALMARPTRPKVATRALDCNSHRVVAKPHWDAALRRLWFGNILVKEFRRIAPVAARILEAFEEEKWAEQIDDPLTPRPGREEKSRLRNEIQALNRRLDVNCIQFLMDGTGQGIRWKPAGASKRNTHRQDNRMNGVDAKLLGSSATRGRHRQNRRVSQRSRPANT